MGASSSSPAPVLLPDDVILEILLCVPPEPIYLLRASLVCRKWRDLIRDPAFLRRFRARHRHAAPLVGFFRHNGSFVPAGEAPDRVAAKHFSQLHGAGRWRVFDSRHGRVLLSAGRRFGEMMELLVWDPITGHRTYISPPRNVLLAFPGANGLTYTERSDPIVQPHCARAALVCDHGGAGDDCHSRPFRVVLMFPNSGSMFAGVYSSKAGAWGDVARVHGWWETVSQWQPNSVLAGNVVYWPERHGTELLGYNLGTNQLQHVEGFHPDDDPFDCVQVFRAADGGLRLDALLPSPTTVASSSSPPPMRRADAVGFDEDGSTIFLDRGDGVFAVHLESLRVNKVLETGMLRPYMDDRYMVPYMSFFVAGGCCGDDSPVQMTRLDMSSPEALIEHIYFIRGWLFNDNVGSNAEVAMKPLQFLFLGSRVVIIKRVEIMVLQISSCDWLIDGNAAGLLWNAAYFHPRGVQG